MAIHEVPPESEFEVVLHDSIIMLSLDLKSVTPLM
jgi:hypothetical protein